MKWTEHQTVESAREAGECRICGEPIVGTFPEGWQFMFGKMQYPLDVVLNFGAEFAHQACLDEDEEEPE